MPAPGQKTPPRALQRKKFQLNISRIQIPDPKPSLVAEIHDFHLRQKSATRADYLPVPLRNRRPASNKIHSWQASIFRYLVPKSPSNYAKYITGISKQIQFQNMQYLHYSQIEINCTKTKENIFALDQADRQDAKESKVMKGFSFCFFLSVSK